MTNSDETYMRRAVVLARRGVGKTSPNPAVGCVIVKDGVIVGEGWHRKAGTPHAEVHALAAAGPLAQGADVFVTLEPCAHYGKTPPCAEALVAARVGRVVAGMVDPNPLVAGKGLELLRRNGIPATAGCLSEECRLLNEPFLKHVATGMPFVILKSALTLDGKTATSSGDSRWVTGDRARRYVHRLRGRVDAIMVGVGTLLADDPRLTARVPGGRDPLRVIVDSDLRTPPAARALNRESRAGTVIATVCRDKAKREALTGAGAEILACRERERRVDLADLLARLGERGVQSILLEGGSVLAGEALRLGLIDKCLLFFAPKLVGGEGVGLFAGAGIAVMDEAWRLERVRIRTFGDDFLVEGYPEVACSRD